MAFVTVTVFDGPLGTRSETVLMEDDFAFAANNWNEYDQLLADLQHLPMFTGLLRWCDLTPVHYRLLVERNLTRVADLAEQERGNPENPTVWSLNFLLSMLIHAINLQAEAQVNSLRIWRLGDMKAQFEYSAYMEEAFPEPPQSGFQVIVDNTN